MVLTFLILAEVILLECVLALSNIWFITFLGERLPSYCREKAAFLGLFFTWVIRVLVLAFSSSLTELHFTINTVQPMKFYWIDVLLFISGSFVLFRSASLLFFRHVSGVSTVSLKLNVVLLQGLLISTILSVDAVRIASFYISERWVVIVVVLGSMVGASWASGMLIKRLHPHATGFYLLLFSTGLLLVLEAFHVSLLSELICIGFVLYILNTFFLSNQKKLSEKA